MASKMNAPSNPSNAIEPAAAIGPSTIARFVAMCSNALVAANWLSSTIRGGVASNAGRENAEAMPCPNENTMSNEKVSANTDAIDATAPSALASTRIFRGPDSVDGGPCERTEHDRGKQPRQPYQADLARVGVEHERGVPPDRDEAGPRADLTDRLAGQKRPEPGAERPELGHVSTLVSERPRSAANSRTPAISVSVVTETSRAVEHFVEHGWALTDPLDDDGVDRLQQWVDDIACWPDDGDGWLHHREMTDHGPELCRSENLIPFHDGLPRVVDDWVVARHCVGVAG